MVFIFIWFQFLTISFALSSELSFDVVIVRPAVPGGSCILTASAHPPHLFLLPSALGTGSLLHPSFLFSRQALSPAAAELGILLWQPVSPFCPNPSFKNSPHPRDLSRMKMVSYRQQMTDWKTTMYFRPPSSYALSVEFPRSNFAHVSASFPTFLVIFQFLTNCLSVII